MQEDELSSNHRKILNQFRSNLSDVLTPHHTDAVLLKWLRGRNFHLKKAERSFRQIDFHKKIFDVENIVENYVKPKVLQKYERTWFLGFSKDGHPVRYAYLHFDLSGFVQSVQAFDINSYLINIAESDLKAMRDHNLEAGLNHDATIYIFNMEGYSFQDLSNKAMLETVLEYFRLFQEYYPEFWSYIFFINVPSIFEKIMLLFKPILKQTFLEKVKITSKDSSKELLRQYIDDDVLPEFLGGNRVDSKGDPYFSEHINPYSKIPEEYYLKNCTDFITETDPGVKVATIRARSCFNVSYVLKTSDNRIRLEFRTESGGLNFGICYRELGPNPDNPVIPKIDEYIDANDENSDILVAASKLRVQCHLAPCSATFKAIKAGIYILNFDNTSSWFGSRKLFYRISVISPES